MTGASEKRDVLSSNQIMNRRSEAEKSSSTSNKNTAEEDHPNYSHNKLPGRGSTRETINTYSKIHETKTVIKDGAANLRSMLASKENLLRSKVQGSKKYVIIHP